MHIFLDSSPLGLLSKPVQSTEVVDITNWTAACLTAGHKIYVPEVIHYEVRRELLRAGKATGVAKLEGLKIIFRYVPITTAAIDLAAELWAKSRNRGTPTGDPKKLDIDVILAAQALTQGIPTSNLIIATENDKHLSRFAPADQWQHMKL